MQVLLITDKEAKSPLAQDLQARVPTLLEERGNAVEVLEIGVSDVVPCLGCLLCLTKRHGACVSDDAIAKLNLRIGDFDLVVFLGPLVFGQFSSTIKSATEKTDTHRMLRSRFVIAIGYGDDVSDDELATFLDIYRKHLGAADVLHTLFPSRALVFASRSLEENDAVCAELGRAL